jgi:phosphatidylglycerophosphate synthase
MKRTDRVLAGVLLLCVAVWGAVISLPFAVWISFVSVLIGAAVTAFFSWFYYQRASEELRTEAERLRRHTTLIMRGLEEAGLVEYNQDEQGEITGIVIKLSGAVGSGGGMSGTLTVGDEDDNDAHQG